MVREWLLLYKHQRFLQSGLTGHMFPLRVEEGLAFLQFGFAAQGYPGTAALPTGCPVLRRLHMQALRHHMLPHKKIKGCLTTET